MKNGLILKRLHIFYKFSKQVQHILLFLSTSDSFVLEKITFLINITSELVNFTHVNPADLQLFQLIRSFSCTQTQG